MTTAQTPQNGKTSEKIDDLVMNINYNIKKGSFKITGNVNTVGQKIILETFLESQIGAGADKSKPNTKEVYNIRFNVDLSYDNIKVSSDTGNKSLRDGILLKVYSKLD
jgi:hypothetical protein